MHCLVLRLSAMGDVAMTLPVLRSALQQNGDLKITMVSHKNFAPFFYGIDNLNFFSVDLKGRHKGLLGIWRLSRELQKLEPFDQIIDLHSVLRSHLLSYLISGKVFRLDKGRRERKRLLSGKAPSILPMQKRYVAVFQSAGWSMDLKANTSMQLKTSALNESQKVLREVSREQFPKIGIAPFAKHFTKAWPYSRVKELVADLSENHEVFLFGGPGEEAKKLKELADSHQHVTSLAGYYAMETELALIAKMDVMLTMDSGNMHLAALNNIPVVSIWGGTSPRAGFLPVAQNELRVLEDLKLECRPCSIFGRGDCPKEHFLCMQNISVELVKQNIREVIEKNVSH